MRKNEKFVLISGLSGSGKSTAIKVFEDLGYYCVDNLPLALLPTFVDLCRHSEGLSRVAMGVDIREREFLKEFFRVYRNLKKQVPIDMIYLESSRQVLARRFSETRRRHPLAMEGPLAEGIDQEMDIMAPIRDLADRIIDTSDMTVHELKKVIAALYRADEEGQKISVSLTSFGYRFGIPFDADIVLDVRFLPNPHFIDELRPLTGRNARVKQFILSFPQTVEFLKRIGELLDYLIPLYIVEGKSYLSIALGCTGGRHRSVAMVEELKKRLEKHKFKVETIHRDIGKEV